MDTGRCAGPGASALFLGGGSGRGFRVASCPSDPGNCVWASPGGLRPARADSTAQPLARPLSPSRGASGGQRGPPPPTAGPQGAGEGAVNASLSSRGDCHHRVILSPASGHSRCSPVISHIISSATILLVSRWGRGVEEREEPALSGEEGGGVAASCAVTWLLTDGRRKAPSGQDLGRTPCCLRGPGSQLYGRPPRPGPC